MKILYWISLFILFALSFFIRCSTPEVNVLQKYCTTLPPEEMIKDERCSYCYSPTGNIILCPDPYEEYRFH